MPDYADNLRVCMVAPFPPRKGGVTVQTALLVRYLEESGVKVVRVDTNIQGLRGRGLGPIRLLIQPWVVLFRILRNICKCEIVQFQAASYWGFMPAALGVPIARLFKKRCVISYHGGMGARFMDRVPWLVKPIFKMASVSAVCSQQLQESFQKRGVETCILPNLFDSTLFTFRERPSVAPKMVWTRAMEDVYDPIMAVKAYSLIRDRYPEATLVMAGDGTLAGAVRDYIAEHKLDGITLTGRVASEEIARLMNEADVCINTSNTDGLPTAMLEAAASGLPIVTTPAGGIATLFVDGVSALMVEFGDAQGMADSVARLLDNPEMAREMGRAASAVAAEHTWLRASGVVAGLYELPKERLSAKSK